MSILSIYGGGEPIVFDGAGYVLTGLDCHDIRCLAAEYKSPSSVGILHGDTAIYSRRCVLRGVVLSGDEETLAQRRARLGRALAPCGDITMKIGNYSAAVYTESMPEYASEEQYGAHTGASAFAATLIMPYPAMLGEEKYLRLEGISHSAEVEMDGDLPVGFGLTAELSGEENEVTVITSDEDGDSRSLTVTYDFVRGDMLTVTTLDSRKAVTLTRDGELIDLLGVTECEKFPRLAPGVNSLSFSDTSAAVQLTAYPAYLNIEELLL